MPGKQQSAFSVLPMRTPILLFLALALTAFLRFYRLDGYGLWSDEFVTLAIVSSESFREVIRTCFAIPQPIPPLYFLLNKWVYGFFPPGEIALRVLSAAASVLAGYLLFVVGRLLFSAEVGLWGLFLYAVNSTQIVYAQNARPYALALALSTASTGCLLKWRCRHSRAWALGYVAASALLLHTHYLFFPMLMAHWLYLAVDAGSPSAGGAKPWRLWLKLHAGIAVSLLPLCPQLWQIVHARHSLNWERKYPAAKDLLAFLELRPLLAGLAVGLLLYVGCRTIPAVSRRWSSRLTASDPPRNRKGLLLLGLWYFLPLSLFFGLAYGNGLNLFVERYMILASLPPFLALPALALAACPKWIGRSALVVYLSVYVWIVPATYFRQKGQLSQGVPGGNEWRETLSQLAFPKFQSSVFLFQSPFIESNRLDFSGDSQLLRYLSAPLQSFYVKKPGAPFVLLPVHWWIESEPHWNFKSRLRVSLLSQRDFTLLATQEFFDYFEPWLKSQSRPCGEWRVVESFRSSGALRLKRLAWFSPSTRLSVRDANAT